MKNCFVHLLSLGHLSVDLAPGTLPAVLPFLVLYNGLSYTEVAGLMFASSCLSSIVQPFFGFWADKTAKNWFLPLGILTSGLGLGLSGLASNYWLVFLSITVMGIGSSIFHPVAARLVNRTAEKKATGMGIFSVGGNIGFGVGPLVAAAALTAWGTAGTSVFAAWGVATAGVILWALPRMAPAFALMLWVPSIWWIFPLLVVVSFTLIGTYAAFVVLGQSYLQKNVGFASGVTMGLAASLGGIFTPLLGVLADA